MNLIKHVAIIMDGNGRWGIKNKGSRNEKEKQFYLKYFYKNYTYAKTEKINQRILIYFRSKGQINFSRRPHRCNISLFVAAAQPHHF